jgi:hypothetical protein
MESVPENMGAATTTEILDCKGAVQNDGRSWVERNAAAAQMRGFFAALRMTILKLAGILPLRQAQVRMTTPWVVGAA